MTPTIAEMTASRRRNQKRRDRRQNGPRKQRHTQQEVEPKCGSEKLGQVGRHGHDFHQNPHADNDRFGKVRAAVLSQVHAGREAQLGRERLDEHGHEVAGENDPDQHVAELRAGLNVGREVTRVNVRDAGDERRPQEGH
jgi:hypothetical protein